jgi:hypothetical protein
VKSLDETEARAKLTAKERGRLEALERVVGKSLGSFIEAGQALLEIRDGRLYRESHASFEDYCRERWELGARRAYQLIDATAVAQIVCTTVHTYPANERQVRELAALRDEPQTMTAVWESARAMAAERERPVTAADVRAARKMIAPPATSAPDDAQPAPGPARPVVAAQNDSRFEAIEDAVSLLQAIPMPEQLPLPTEPGDIEALGESIEWLEGWLPRLSAAWKRHRSAVGAQRLRAV